MSTHPVRALAAEAARTVGRRLRARRRHGGQAPARVRGHVGPAPLPEAEPIPLPLATRPGEAVAEDAELDALRGALVRELDRLAAEDDGSASFRRAG
jgi:hypothetical protein